MSNTECINRGADDVTLAWSGPSAITRQVARSLRAAVTLLASLCVRVVCGLRERRLNRQIDGVVAERLRFARELHDTLLQALLGTSLQVQVAIERLRADDPTLPLLNRVVESLSQAADDGRNIIRELRMDHPVSNLERALSEIPRKFTSLSEPEFRITAGGTVRSLDPLVQEEIYWIGREAILNALHHSRCSQINVEFRYGVHEFRLVVRDNGSGMEPRIARLGREGRWGVRGMQERAARILSRLKIRSARPGGTEVELCVPARIVYRCDTGTDSVLDAG
jgi:signal transduction histidine kinase